MLITSLIAMQIDELCSGKVTKILPDMAVVTLDKDVLASLHISMISNEQVETIEEVFAVGDELKAVVVSIARRTGIRLSTKVLELVPGQMKTDKQAVFASADKGLAQHLVTKKEIMEQRRQALSHLQ
ncbi:30S ribosomal protein S1, partial [Haematococcus lacustris]